MGKSRTQSILLAVILASFLLTACGDAGTEIKQNMDTTQPPAVQETTSPSKAVDFSAVDDSSELPSWQGKQLKAVYWEAFGTAASERIKALGDVVWPEITRITGVSYDTEKSFDNGGDTMEVKMGKIMASNAWPHVITNPDRTQLRKLVDAGLIWDLTGYVEQYCPNLVKNFPKDKLPEWWNSSWVNVGQAGRIHALPHGLQPKWQSLVDPGLDRGKWSALPGAMPQDPSPYIYVRDDVLKRLFPNARSRDELEALYEKRNGRLTKEDILDVPLNSREDFINFLYAIKALGLKENGKQVYPTYTVAGGNDNWHLLTCLFLSLYGANPNGMQSGDINYYTFWDKRNQRVDYTFKQPFFKDMLQLINRLVRDKVASAQAILDNDTAFREKLDSGLYAVCYAWNIPNEAALQKANKPFRYRRVYINVRPDTESYCFTRGSMADGMGVAAFVKSKVSEEELIQLLRMYDLMMSETGFKLASWGPKTAGLWEVREGKRVFKDKDVEACMVYNVENEKDIYYHLFRGLNLGKFGNVQGGYPSANHKYLPVYYYDKQLKASDMMNGFFLGSVDPFPQVPGTGPSFWLYANDANPGIKKFNITYSIFNSDLIRTMTAKNDVQFDQYFQQMLDNAEKNGATEEARALLDRQYKEANKEYMTYMK